MNHVTITRPFQRRFVLSGLGLVTISQLAKFEVFMFTHYEDMKGDEKCKNLGGLEGLGSPKVIGYITIR